MSTDTSKGIPVPAATDTFDVPGDLEKIADWINANPGIGTFTTAQRDVLVGDDIWPGRIIFNSTTSQLEQNKTGTAGAGGWSPVTPADLVAGTPSMRTLGTGAQQAAAGNDPRLSDARTPTGAAGGKLSGTYPNPGIAAGAVGTTELADNAVTAAKIPNASLTDAKVAAGNKDGTAGTPSMRTLGTGAQQAAAGNHTHDAADVTSGTFPLVRLPVAASGTSSATQVVRADDSRLSDARTPTGAAGGKLSGTYPNPGIAAGAVGTTELADSSVTSTKIADGTIVHGDVAAANKDGAAGTPSMRTLGTGAQQAAAGNHGHADLAPLASPAFTGNPTAPTPAAGDNDTSIATTAFVQDLLAGTIIGGDGYIDIGPIRIAWGVITLVWSNSVFPSARGAVFPVAFSAAPIALCGIVGVSNNFLVEVQSVSPETIIVEGNTRNGSQATGNVPVHWIAIGTK